MKIKSIRFLSVTKLIQTIKFMVESYLNRNKTKKNKLKTKLLCNPISLRKET